MRKIQTTVAVSAFTILLAASVSVLAEINKGQHLNTRGQSKVNSALAKGYAQGGAEGGGSIQQTQVNIGSRKAGNCTMNVGTQPSGGKGSKEVIVTSKDIINICK